MTAVNLRTLKDLSAYVTRAEQGEHIVVHRGGRPVALLLPLPEHEERSLDEVCADMARRGLMHLPEEGGEIVLPDPPVRTPSTRTAGQMVAEDRR